MVVDVLMAYVSAFLYNYYCQSMGLTIQFSNAELSDSTFLTAFSTFSFYNAHRVLKIICCTAATKKVVAQR